MIEAFSQERIPDNHGIRSPILYVKNTSQVEIDKLSPDGRKLIQGARDIIKTAGPRG
jgi:hypothetical protein